MFNRFVHAGTELFLGVTNSLKAFIRVRLPFNAIRHTAHPGLYSPPPYTCHR